MIIIAIVFYLAFIALMVVSMWKIFEKAGKPGWACIIPIYSNLVMLEVVKKPWWWLLLMFIPYVGVVWAIWSLNLLVKSFGKEAGFTVGVIFLPFIFLPILAFGDSTYTEPGEPIPLKSEPGIIDSGIQ